MNCGAPINRKLNKCPYCGTPYDCSGFNASFENAVGTISIAGKEYQVYLGDYEVSTIDLGCYTDMNGTLHSGKTTKKRKFTLIEV